MLLNLVCPTCSEPLAVPEQYAGQLMRCPQCQGKLIIPQVGEDGSAPEAPLGEAMASIGGDPGPPPSISSASMGGTKDDLSGLGAPGVFQAPTWESAVMAGATEGEAGNRFMLVICPACSVEVAIPQVMAGQVVRCPACHAGLGASAPGEDSLEGIAFPLADTSSVEEAGAPEAAPEMASETLGEMLAREQQEFQDRLEARRQHMAQVEEEIREFRRRAREGADLVPPDADVPDYGNMDGGNLLPPEDSLDPAEEAEARKQANQRNREIADANRLRSGLQDREGILAGRAESAADAREARNRNRRGSAQQRLANRIPGAGMVRSGMALAKDIADALGYSDEAPSQAEQEMLGELQQMRSLLEALVRESTNDGTSRAERNRGESTDGGDRRERRERKAASASRPMPETSSSSSPASPRRAAGPLRPSRPVPSAGTPPGAGARAPSEMSRVIAVLLRVLGS